MKKYIALLRGINVGGHKSIKMTQLVKLMQSLGFENVTSYIQSGNICFESALGDYKQLEKNIEQKISTEFGFDAPVIVISADELKAIIAKNPFKIEDLTSLYVTFLKSCPEHQLIHNFNAFAFTPDKIVASESAVYSLIVNGYAQTKFNNLFI